MQAYLSVSTVGSTKIAGGFRYLDYYSSSKLYIPLDAHVAKMAHQLGITTRKTEDWKMVQQVTNYMKTIFPDDPCREILHYSDIVLTINNLHYVRT